MREQIKAITEELGEADSPQSEAEGIQGENSGPGFARGVREKLLKECDRLYKMPFGSHEANVSAITWISVWSCPGIVDPS